MVATDPQYDWIQKGVYRCIAGLTAKCTGYLYEVVEPRIMDVPQFQVKVLVRCLSGPDKGMIPFTVTLANFARRYERVNDVAPAELVAGGSG